MTARLFKIGRRRPGIVDFYTPLTQGLDTLGYRIAWAPNFDAGSFTTIINSSNVGYLDPNVNRYTVDTQPTTGKDVRIVFNPASYTAAITGTYNVTGGSPSVPTSTSQVGLVYPGAAVTFGSQPGVPYTVLTVTSSTITLTAPYTGTSNAATTGVQGINDTRSFWLQFSQITGGVQTLVSAPTLILPDSANKGQGLVTIAGTAPSETSSASSLQLDLPFLMQNFQITNTQATGVLYVSTEAGGPEMALGPNLGFPSYQTIWGVQPSIWVRGGGTTVTFSATFTLAFPR
jgi:hypothetical protein